MKVEEHKMKMKKELTFKRHVVIGKELREMRDRLMKLHLEICRYYRVAGKDKRPCQKAIEGIDALRSIMDDAVCREYPERDDQEVVNVYYPKDRYEVSQDAKSK